MKVWATLAVFWFFAGGEAFWTNVLPATRRAVDPSALRLSAAGQKPSSNDQPTLDDLRSRSVKQLKEELQALQVSTRGAREKEDLVQRLYEAQSNPQSSSSAPPLTTELLLSSLEQDTPVQTQSFGQDFNFRPSAQPYCAIRVKVQGRSLFPNNGDDNDDSVLTLLVDTACSGILLKPTVVERLGLPVVTSPVTMTSGGGTASANSQVATLEHVSIILAGNTTTTTSRSRNLGPLPAVVQDIGALPNSLDGILGLSVLTQYDTMELDFATSTLSLWEQSPPPPLSYQKVVAAPLHRLGALGIYAVDAWWGGRGPVRMLVDTGAASTYWSWMGVVEDLGIPQGSPTIQRLPSNMGIMGSDNMATGLTHRIYVSSRMSLTSAAAEGLSLADDRRLAVDIGDLPILQQLRSQGIGGILGLDVLRRAALVRFRGWGSQAFLEIYEKENSNRTAV